MRTTFHLLPAETWVATDPAAPYVAPSLASEGFIHCTDGAEELIATANRYYHADPRPYIVLTIDLDRVASPWRIEDPAGLYPHVYGPIAPAAIVASSRVVRDADGTFVRIAG